MTFRVAEQLKYWRFVGDIWLPQLDLMIISRFSVNTGELMLVKETKILFKKIIDCWHNFLVQKCFTVSNLLILSFGLYNPRLSWFLLILILFRSVLGIGRDPLTDGRRNVLVDQLSVPL